MRTPYLSDWVTRYSVLYFLCFITEGLLIGSLGPSIPIKAKLSGRLEIDYSFVFTFFGYGLIIGCAIVNKIQKTIGSHNAISLGLLLNALISFVNYS